MTKSNFNYIIMWMHSAVKEVLILSGSSRKGSFLGKVLDLKLTSSVMIEQEQPYY